MRNRIELPPELSFLGWVQDRDNKKYQSAPWLLSGFGEDVWLCDFDGSQVTIDFRIRLKDGTLLSENHRGTVTIFKSWLCVQTHRDATGGRVLNAMTARHKISDVLRLIDFLLLNNARYRILEEGFSCITANDLKSILAQVASSSTSSDSIYQWYKRVASFAKDAIGELPADVYSEIIEDNPEIVDFDIAPDDMRLPLDLNEIITFRVWLWWKGYFKCSFAQNYQYQPSITKLAELIYSGTLWGKQTNFPTIVELQFSPIERYTREFKAVATRTSVGKKIDKRRVNVLRSAIKSLAFLAKVDLPVPCAAIDDFELRGWLSVIDTKETGRFASIPQEVVFTTLRKSVDFALDYGRDILKSYINIAIEANAQNINIQSYCHRHGINHLLDDKIRRLGVSTWILGQTMALAEANPSREKSERAPAKTYFSRLRKNEGLFDLILVLYGSIQIAIGVLMARRQAELVSLSASDCLDKSEQYLIFYNRKTGIDGLRKRELRPIPPLAVQLIKILKELQNALVSHGLIQCTTSLFSVPHRTNPGLSTCSASTYNTALDRACDYFNVETNENEERYYLRQHSLRRFFATLFFWGKSFGGMDTLRWFLGHTDVEHLYHYITESTPGAVLRWTKAVYVSTEIVEGTSPVDGLANLIEARFKTRDFSLLDSDELTLYIDSMMEDGLVSVEPFFFDSGTGKEFKILVELTTKAQHG